MTTVIYIVGPPGVGKLTVARLLEAQLPAHLVHNHATLNLLTDLVDQDRMSALPEAIWPLALRLRETVFEAMATLSPPDWNFVLTHGAMGPGDALDHAQARMIIDMATTRGARLLLVQLTARAEVLAARMASAERAALNKLMNAEHAARHAARAPFAPDVPEVLTIDTTDLSPQQTADRILTRLRDPAATGNPPAGA